MASHDPEMFIEGRCVKCRKIRRNPNRWDEEIEHYDTAAELEESAARSCHLCRSFRARLIYNDTTTNKLPPGPYRLSFFQDMTLNIHFGNTSNRPVGDDLIRAPAAQKHSDRGQLILPPPKRIIPLFTFLNNH